MGRRIQANYDVKDEIGSETMKWIDSLCDIRKELGVDWQSLTPLQKMCLYWLTGDICGDTHIRSFDCDGSEYMQEIYAFYPVRITSAYLAPKADTLTSAWSPIKKYLNLDMGKTQGVRLLLSEEGREYRKKLEDIGAMDFLEVNHTIGNFMPVPNYLNAYRTGFTGAPEYLAAYDQADLLLQAIYDYYSYRFGMDANLYVDLHGKDTDTLIPLLGEHSNSQMECIMPAIKGWLDHFGTWDVFVNNNMLESMVEHPFPDEPEVMPGPPLKFFSDHSLEKPYPECEDDWRLWFSNSAGRIRARGEEVAGRIECIQRDVEKDVEDM